MAFVTSVMMLDSLDTERQMSREKKILYIVENSTTLLLSLMLFWFVCVKKQKLFLYTIVLFCGGAVNVSQWLEVRSECKKITFLRALNFSLGSMSPKPLVKLAQIAHAKSWIHP